MNNNKIWLLPILKTYVGCLLILSEMNNDNIRLLPMLKQMSAVCLYYSALYDAKTNVAAQGLKGRIDCLY